MPFYNRRKPQIYRDDREGTALSAIETYKPSARPSARQPPPTKKTFEEPQRTVACVAQVVKMASVVVCIISATLDKSGSVTDGATTSLV